MLSTRRVNSCNSHLNPGQDMGFHAVLSKATFQCLLCPRPAVPVAAGIAGLYQKTKDH